LKINATSQLKKTVPKLHNPFHLYFIIRNKQMFYSNLIFCPTFIGLQKVRWIRRLQRLQLFDCVAFSCS